MKGADLSHGAIVKIAERWLRARNPVVLIEAKTVGSVEEPDAIAWDRRGRSTLVEAKATRADFMVDKKKVFRANPDMGMGSRRFYAAPPGVVRPGELPEGWGLIEVTRRGPRVVIEAREQPRNVAGEITLLVSALERATEGWGHGVFGDRRQTTAAHPKIEAKKRSEERRLARSSSPDPEVHARVERERGDLGKQAAEFDRLFPKIPVRR